MAALMVQAEELGGTGELSVKAFCQKRERSWGALGVLYFLLACLWVGLAVIHKYLIAGIHDPPNLWSRTLPLLGTTFGRQLAMGTHFACGSFITLAGFWQLAPYSRRPAWLWLHRLAGRVFVVCAILTFCGGVGFILQQPMLVGGPLMTTSFVISGFLVLGFSLMAYFKARAKDIEEHRRWAIRAFGQSIGSFLYRLLMAASNALGLLNSDADRTPSEDGIVPYFADSLVAQLNAWLFWVLPLLFVEWYLNAPAKQTQHRILDIALALFGVFFVVCIILAM